jgi:hypothetical protein
VAWSEKRARFLLIAPFKDSGYWHRRAEEARVVAEQMSSEEAKRTMLRAADNYDKLAIMASDRQSLLPKSRPPKLERKTVISSLNRMRDIAFAIALGAISAALVAGSLVGMTWHDQRLLLLIASMLVALYSLFRDDERLILLALGALVALYVPFVVIG